MSSKVENTIDKEKEYELSKIMDLLEDSANDKAINEQISKKFERIMERQNITTFCIHFSLVDSVMWVHHVGRQDVAIRTWTRSTWMPGHDRQVGPPGWGWPPGRACQDLVFRIWPSRRDRQDVAAGTWPPG